MAEKTKSNALVERIWHSLQPGRRLRSERQIQSSTRNL